MWWMHSLLHFFSLYVQTFSLSFLSYTFYLWSRNLISDCVSNDVFHLSLCGFHVWSRMQHGIVMVFDTSCWHEDFSLRYISYCFLQILFLLYVNIFTYTHLNLFAFSPFWGILDLGCMNICDIDDQILDLHFFFFFKKTKFVAVICLRFVSIKIMHLWKILILFFFPLFFVLCIVSGEGGLSASTVACKLVECVHYVYLWKTLS